MKRREFLEKSAVAVCRRGGATAVYESLNMPFQMMNFIR